MLLQLPEQETVKILLASDLHGCFLDRRAFKVFLQIATEYKWDFCILNGDTADFSQISTHPSKLRSLGHDFLDVPTLDEEINFIHFDILQPLRRALGNKTKIIYRLGNHEARWNEVQETNGKALSELLKTMRKAKSLYLEDILGLDRLNITLDHDPIMEINNLFTVVHGVKTSKAAAKQNFATYGSGTSGHTHRLSSFVDLIGGHRAKWIESGCLRTLRNVEYLPIGSKPDWSHGFVELIFRPKQNRFHAHEFAIVEYETYFRDVLYSA